MKVTVYLNENSRFAKFDPATAELREAIEFELDVADYDYLAGYNAANRATAHLGYIEDDQAEAEYNRIRKDTLDSHLLEWALPILEKVYTQLNVGGDIYPAERYTKAYRGAENRSLSVGDVVVLEGTGGRQAFSVGNVGWEALISHILVRRAAFRYERSHPHHTDATIAVEGTDSYDDFVETYDRKVLEFLDKNPQYRYNTAFAEYLPPLPEPYVYVPSTKVDEEPGDIDLPF